MSHRESLDTRCVKSCGVITLPKDYPFSVLRGNIVNMFQSMDYIVKYYLIYHDEDSNNLHFHFAITLNCQKRLKTLLNEFESFLKIDRDYIGVESLKSLSGMLIYFIHANEEHKKEYLVEDIISNDSEDIIFQLIDSKQLEISTAVLIENVLRYSHDTDIMLSLGLNVYHKYRNEIKILREESYYLQNRFKHLVKDDGKELPF